MKRIHAIVLTLLASILLFAGIPASFAAIPDLNVSVDSGYVSKLDKLGSYTYGAMYKVVITDINSTSYTAQILDPQGKVVTSSSTSTLKFFPTFSGETYTLVVTDNASGASKTIDIKVPSLVTISKSVVRRKDTTGTRWVTAVLVPYFGIGTVDPGREPTMVWEVYAQGADMWGASITASPSGPCVAINIVDSYAASAGTRVGARYVAKSLSSQTIQLDWVDSASTSYSAQLILPKISQVPVYAIGTLEDGSLVSLTSSSSQIPTLKRDSEIKLVSARFLNESYDLNYTYQINGITQGTVYPKYSTSSVANIPITEALLNSEVLGARAVINRNPSVSLIPMTVFRYKYAPLVEPPTKPTINVTSGGKPVNPATWTGADTKLIVSGSTSADGIASYEYQVQYIDGSISSWKTMTATNTENKNGTTNVLEATLIPTAKGIYKVRAVSNNGEISEVTSFDLYLDSKGPANPQFTTDPAGMGAYKVTFTVSDAPEESKGTGSSGIDSVRLATYPFEDPPPKPGDPDYNTWKDPNAWVSEPTITVDLSNPGKYIFEAKDRVGNLTQFEYTLTNTSLPVLAYSIDNDAHTITLTVTNHGTDGLKAIQIFDETKSTWKELSKTSPYTYTFTGNRIYQFRAEDNAGNFSNTISVSTSGIDDAKPTIKGQLISNQENTYGPVKVTLTTADVNVDGSMGSGVVRVEMYKGTAWETLTTDIEEVIEHSIDVNGTYRFRAVDASGKISDEYSVKVSSIDSVKPVVNISKTEKDSSGTFVTIYLEANDPATSPSVASGVSVIQVFDGANWSDVAYETTGTYTVGTNGTYKFRVIDKAGLISKEASVKIDAFDSVPPTLSSTVEYKDTYAVITLTASDNSGKLNGIDLFDSDANSWFTISKESKAQYTAVANGTYKFRAVDKSGNASADEIVRIEGLTDSSGPVNLLITGGREWTPSKDLIVTANDNAVPAGYTGISGVKEFALTKENKEPSSGWQTGNTFHLTENGLYYLWVRDNVGWVTSQSIPINTIDPVPPTDPTLVVTRTDNDKVIASKEWTNVDAKFTVTEATALSGINRYEYKIGESGKVTAMNVIRKENLTAIDPANKPFSYINVLEAQRIFAIDEMIYVRAVSNSGLTSNWVPFDLWFDNLPPATTSTITVDNDTNWTNKPIRYTFIAKDTPAVPNGSAMSGIWKVRYKSSDEGTGNANVSTDWVEGNTLVVDLKDSTTHRFEAMDHAGNVKEFTYSVKNYDDVMPETWIQDPTHEAAVDMEPDYFLDRIWTNQDITLTLHSRDIAPPNPPSGVAYLTTPDSRVAMPNIGKNATKEFTRTQLIDHNGVFRFASEDAAGNINEINYHVWNIDRVAPTVEWTEDVRYYEGKSTIYINASDDLSGVDYILMPDGKTRVYADLPALDQNYQPGDPTPKLFTKFEVTQNGSYTFTIVDRAGNSITKTFEYQNLRHDYGVEEGSFVLEGKPSAMTDLTVHANLQNFDGPGEDVSVKVYYMEDGQRYLLTTDTVDIPKATADGNPGEFNWKGTINFGDKTDINLLYIMVGEEILHLDLNPNNNTRTLQIDKAPYNYAISSTYDKTFVYPGQMLNVDYTVTATGVGDTRMVPVTLAIGDNTMTRMFVHINQSPSSVISTGNIMVPLPQANKARAVPGAEELDLNIRVNWDDRFKETRQDDNQVVIHLISQMADLSLEVSGNDLNPITILQPNSPQGSFMYPAKYDEYEVTFRAHNEYEKIVSVITAGETFNQNERDFKYTLDLDRGKSQQFTIVVQSAEGSQSQTYTVVIKRGNDNIDVDVIAKIPSGQEFVGIPDDTGNYLINLPVNENDYELTIKMRDPNANVSIVDGNPINENIYVGDHTIAHNSSNTHKVLVTSEDRTLQRNFDVVVTTKNSNPSIRIVNRSELNGNIYGLGGILKGANFVPYGNDITNLEIAHRAGRTNGVVVQVEVKDLNVDQFLRGYMQLPGSDVMYEVHWNTFDGPTVMQVADIDYGYVYIDRTAIRNDIPKQPVTLYVSDYATDSEAETALFTATDKVTFGADITAPVIVGTPNENAGTADNPKGTVTLDVTDSYTGVRNVTYRVTTDNGHTWSEVKSTTANGVIDLADIYGDIVVEVTATDNIYNKSSLNIPLKVTSPDVSVDGDVYTTTNRVADVTFINTRKHNADSVRQDILDTFG